LPRSRCQVRGHERAATHLSPASSLPGPCGIAERVLHVAQSSALTSCLRRNTPRSRDSGSPQENPTDLRTRAIAAGPCSPWHQRRYLPYQADQEETGDKKSFSMASCPILAWSSFTSGSLEGFSLSKTSDALSRRTFFHLSNQIGMNLEPFCKFH